MGNIKEEKIKHLELIQNIVTRLNTNSFQIKGIAIIIVSALLAIYASEKKPDFIIISIFPLILFWFLDAYYLCQERKFIGLYNDLVKNKIDKIEPFEMKIKLYKSGRYSYLSSLFSKTIWIMYLGTSVLMLFLNYYLNY